jgi:hypothetical protein
MCSKQTKIGRRIYRVAMAVTTDFLQEWKVSEPKIHEKWARTAEAANC